MSCAENEKFCPSEQAFSLGLKAKLLVLILSALNGPVQAQSLDQLIDPILSTHRFSEVQISPDGKKLAWVDVIPRNENEYARAVYIAATAEEASPLKIEVPGSRNQFGIAWSPDGKELAFLAETESGLALRVLPSNSSETQLVATPRGEVNTVRWSPDGRIISFLSSESNTPGTNNSRVEVVGQRFDQQRLEFVDRVSGRIRLVTPQDLFVYEYDWSPDGRQLVATAAPCCTEAKGSGEGNWWVSELYRVDAGSGDVTPLLKPAWQAASPKWSPDGRHIAFIGGLMSDFIAPGGDLFVMEADGKNLENITPGLKASVTWEAWSGPGKILGTEIVDGEAAVAEFEIATFTNHNLWRGADGPFTGGLVFALSVAKDGLTSAAVRESFDRAPEIWVGPVGQWRQLSSVNKDKVASWGKAESVHWESDAGRIQGWLLYPASFVSGQKYPLVVLVHGGPAAAALAHWAPAFDDVEVLSSLGYFVLYPNPRGSMGAGEEFTQGNVKDIGHGDLRDIEAGANYVIKNFPIDPNRVGITGWSYGGYMAMWAITQTDMFHASVAGPGVANWQSYYGQVDIEKWVVPYFGASAYAEPAMYARSSPINFVKKVRTPTLFYVGNQDFVCPASQSFELWRALRNLGVDSQMLLYSGEGHGISQPTDQRDISKRTVQWFSEHLR